ncbi:MAG: hypothetical protein ACOCTH_03705 [Halodesulfurarchaeum sp.]
MVIIDTVEPEDHDIAASDVDPEIWAVAAGEEFATEWAVERSDPTVVMVETHRRHGEQVETDGAAIAFDVDQGLTTEEWARQYAERNPREKVEDARRFFEE